MEPRKDIVISGWYGYNNAGDEAILSGMLDTVKAVSPESNFTVLSFNPQQTAGLHGVRSLRQMPPKLRGRLRYFCLGEYSKLTSRLRSAKVFLLGGGGFMSDWQKDALRLWLPQLKLAKRYGAKTFVYGVGVGPLKTEAGRSYVEHMLNKYADCVSVRDETSHALLHSIGVKKAKLTGDPALANVFEACPRIERIPSTVENVGLLFTPHFTEKNFWNENVQLWPLLLSHYEEIARIFLRENKKVTFYCFEPSVDEPLARKIRATVGSGEIFNCDVPPKTILSRMSREDLVVSFRFHGNIFALLGNVPPMGIVYHHKTADFLKAIGLDPWMLPFEPGVQWKAHVPTLDETREKIARVLADHSKMAALVAKNRASLLAAEKRNATMLGELIAT